MVILITGASHTGKTLLAKKLIEKHLFPCLSIDHLKMGLIRSGNTTLTPEDDEELTAYLWPIVREMIKTAIENNQDMIVEGCYVPFDWATGFDDFYLSRIRFVCLCMTDSFIDANITAIRLHESDVESRGEVCPDAETLKRDNAVYREGFGETPGAVTLIGDDYEGTIERLVSEI